MFFLHKNFFFFKSPNQSKNLKNQVLFSAVNIQSTRLFTFSLSPFHSFSYLSQTGMFFTVCRPIEYFIIALSRFVSSKPYTSSLVNAINQEVEELKCRLISRTFWFAMLLIHRVLNFWNQMESALITSLNCRKMFLSVKQR